MLHKPALGAPRSQQEDYLLARCLADRSVLAAAVAKPREAMIGELGHGFPDYFDVKFLVDDESTWHLVIPYDSRPDAEPDELPDELLEMVAGGMGGNSCTQYPCGCCCSRDTTPCCNDLGK